MFPCVVVSIIPKCLLRTKTLAIPKKYANNSIKYTKCQIYCNKVRLYIFYLKLCRTFAVKKV